MQLLLPPLLRTTRHFGCTAEESLSAAEVSGHHGPHHVRLQPSTVRDDLAMARMAFASNGACRPSGGSRYSDSRA